ncbi:hypothetical protein [Frankia sp. EI5c]|nr:hypothetical protein [Frankia sp. EI5c]
MSTLAFGRSCLLLPGGSTSASLTRPAFRPGILMILGAGAAGRD